MRCRLGMLNPDHNTRLRLPWRTLLASDALMRTFADFIGGARLFLLLQ